MKRLLPIAFLALSMASCSEKEFFEEPEEEVIPTPEPEPEPDETPDETPDEEEKGDSIPDTTPEPEPSFILSVSDFPAYINGAADPSEKHGWEATDTLRVLLGFYPEFDNTLAQCSGEAIEQLKTEAIFDNDTKSWR